MAVNPSSTTSLISSPIKPATVRTKKSTSNQPFCDFVNIELLDSMGVPKNKATILLEQPVDQNALTRSDLLKLVRIFWIGSYWEY